FEVTTRMNPDVPLDSFLQALLERLVPGTQAEAGAIFLVHEDEDCVRLVASAGQHGLGRTGTEWPITEPPFDAVVRSGGSLRGSTRVCTPASSHPVGTMAVLTPLAGERVRGALLLIRTDRGFDEQEAALLGLFAAHAGHDIERLTRVVALEEETDRLEVSKRQLAERELEEWQFFADLNREIRSALATIAYRVDACEGEASRDSRPEMSNHIAALAADVRRLSTAVQEGAALLDLEPGPHSLEWAPASLRTVLEDALLRATPLAGSRGVVVEGRLPTDLPEANTDAVRLSRTLSFYLAELLRRTPEGGVLRITARAVLGPEITRRELQCEVRREFDAPWAESARTSHLPLYLLRELVEAGGGAVQEIEEPGERGVRLTMPLAAVRTTSAPDQNEVGGPVVEAA
ncbi:MAG: GAF domain-containing protein, partial [Candidatus Rokuibacteriota bacterium]